MIASTRCDHHLRRLLQHLFGRFLILATAYFVMGVSVAHAETDESIESINSLDDIRVSDRVYKIELIVFAYKDTLDSENLSTSESFTYPEGLKLLKPIETGELVIPREPTEGEKKASIGANELYQQLSSSQLSLRAMASAFKLRQGYRLLFHGGWFQQLDSHSQQAPVLIEGGNWFSPYFELSGSIKLSKNRYVQVHSDLWLADFLESDLGNTQQPWHASNSTPARPTLASSNDARRTANNHAPDSIQVGLLKENLPDSPLLYEYDQQPELGANDYIPRRVFQLKEKRNLRSGELHYIDHPKFGAIVQVTSLSDVYSESLSSQ